MSMVNDQIFSRAAYYWISPNNRLFQQVPSPLIRNNLTFELVKHQCLSRTFLRFDHVVTAHDVECSAVLNEALPLIGFNGVEATIHSIAQADALDSIKWAHRLGELAAEHGGRSGRANALELVSNGAFGDHPVHGASWGQTVRRGHHDQLWVHFDRHTRFLHPPMASERWNRTAIRLLSSACHGQGHALSFWSPNSTRFQQRFQNLDEAVVVCTRARLETPWGHPAFNNYCSAACVDGILHESIEASIVHTWGGTARSHPCSTVSAFSYFCYRWGLAPATFEDCAKLPASQAIAAANRAGCIAAVGGRGASWGAHGRNASVTCEPLLHSSTADWVSCSYGSAWMYGLELGAMPAWLTPHAHCSNIWKHHVFVQMICIQETLLPGSSSYLLHDETFLTMTRANAMHVLKSAAGVFAQINAMVYLPDWVGAELDSPIISLLTRGPMANAIFDLLEAGELDY